MLKRLMDVLDTDKTRFSNEELNWQRGFKIRSLYWLFITFFISIAIFALTVVFTENTSEWVVMIGCLLVVMVLIGLVCEWFSRGAIEAEEQLKENLVQEIKEKILSCIEQEDFSKLILDSHEISQVLFQLAIKEKLISIYKGAGMTFIEIKKEKAIWTIKNSEIDLLEFFDIKEDE